MRHILVARILTSVAFCFSSSVFAAGLPETNPCSTALPSSLRAAIHEKYPIYRLPNPSDSDQQLVRENRDAAGNGCILVTKGDFDGDRIDDYAVLLMPTDSKPPRLVVALRHNSSWRLTTLRDFPDVDRADLYIATLKPGRFTRTASADGPLEHGEVRAAQSKYQGIAAGISESSEIGFFFLNGRWKHIWIAD